MNLRPTIATLILLGAPALFAQNVPQEPQEDPVQKAIREFNRREAGAANEVVVVLDPAADTLAADALTKPEAAQSPVLVTGNAPEDDKLIEANSDESTTESTADTEETAPEAAEGLAVRVQQLQSGKGSIDPSQVKLLAPFPAKPLAQPPAGWRLETSEDAPPFTREVEVSKGNKITLTIRPHLLVPEADGALAFSVPEPGYDPSLGYRQSSTVSAILATSVEALENDSRQLGNAIDQLQQLLVSLPSPDPAPDPKTPAKSKR